MFDAAWFLTLFLHVLPMAATPEALHPHYPYALTARGAAGDLTVTYMTVDYNPERLEGLEKGFEWHLAFAALETAFPIQSGDVQVPAGKYKLDVMLGGEEDGEWSVLLTPYDLWRARMTAQRARDDERRASAEKQVADIEAALKENGAPLRAVLPTTGRDGVRADHLTIEMVHRGYRTTRNGSIEADGGLSVALRIDMGDEHRVVELAEVRPEKKD